MAVTVDVASIASFVLIVLAWLNGNKRVDDLRSDVTRGLSDLKDVMNANQNALLAHIKALGAELRAEVQGVRSDVDKIDTASKNALKIHELEKHQ
jgi:hypothetical protein